MMPSEETKIFEFNHYHKFDKTPVLKSPAALLKRNSNTGLLFMEILNL